MESASSFDVIFDEYKVSVYSYCFKMVRNSHTAQDIMQEAFLKFFKRYGESFFHDNAPGYVYRIAHNLCIDYIRKEKRIKFIDILSLTGKKAYSIEPGETNTGGNEEVSKYLECLTPTQRSILILHTVNQLPHAQIAIILKKSEAAVRKQYQRAKDRIKERLGRRGVVDYETSTVL